jgi:hypothetical protein
MGARWPTLTLTVTLIDVWDVPGGPTLTLTLTLTVTLIDVWDVPGGCAASVDQMRRQLRGTMPVDAFEADIVRAFGQHRVLLIAGETGCGKSSCVPLMLRDAPGHGHMRLYCCQPHRVAAAGLHARITQLGYECALRMGHGVRQGDSSNARLGCYDAAPTLALPRCATWLDVA